MLVTDGFRDGDVVLVKARPWVRWLTGARYDHAGMVWWLRGRWYTVEAGLSGVRDWTGPHWGRYFEVFRPEWTQQVDGECAVDAALSRLGERYSFRNLIAVIWKMLRRRGVGVQAVVCTELVAASWMAAGVNLCPGNAHPTPDELWAALSGEANATAGGGWPPEYYVDPPPVVGKPIDGAV